ncbi:hypothetical protein Lfu02_49160 [Longispora fulva]|uniref:Alpha-galactosidase n=1 Tax=Longispora fulva TaxID=619741 RepID=A0A8J7GKF6_9ACTN|nr:glycoside hydrolase family 36 protein [Longispora fulva]MBG6138293.1 alpha-galactosidase [Longispora fulva]GIG60544.1 hypothetical protein Lfu02_49160 [Longispora fulva]
MRPVDEIPVDPARARIYEHGWQSWSPTAWHPATGTSPRPVRPPTQVMSYRPGKPGPEVGFHGEGLLAVDPGDGGPVRVYSGGEDVPSIRAALVDGHVVVSADGPVTMTSNGSATVDPLAAWADDFARAAGMGPIRPAPTAWCSWYHYYTDVTEADILENLDAIHRAALPVDVIQIDDGWQSGIGDWLTLSGRFDSLTELTARIAGTGRRSGIWVAPFLVGARSELAAEHPDWLIGDAGHNWDQDLRGLDLTNPAVTDHLRAVFTGLHEAGFDYFKIDFLYAGALPGPRQSGQTPLEAYATGMRAIREAIGDSYLLGCGAPILPSVGLVDGMRVSADVDPAYAPHDGDLSQPSQAGAALSTVGRAFQHGRFWVNDPDCLIVRPAVERREEWAEVVAGYGGLRSCSDRIADLDAWGLETTRHLLATVPPPLPFA